MKDNMKAVKEYFSGKINTGNLLVLVFLLGGFWYITPQAISQNKQAIQEHHNQEFKPLIEEFNKVRRSVTQLKENTLPKERVATAEDLEGVVKERDLESLKELVREIQNSQNQQLKIMNQRLEYIITRIDK